jgi:hypothetical protein
MSTEIMTPKERILAAMSGRMLDRVPVQIGLTNMFSVYYQNLIGWDVYADAKVPMWKVALDTQRAFGLDGYMYLNLPEKKNSTSYTTTEVAPKKFCIIYLCKIFRSMRNWVVIC